MTYAVGEGRRVVGDHIQRSSWACRERGGRRAVEREEMRCRSGAEIAKRRRGRKERRVSPSAHRREQPIGYRGCPSEAGEDVPGMPC